MNGGLVEEEDAVELLLEAARERASTDRGQRRGQRGRGKGRRREEDSERGGRGVEGIME